MIKTTGLHFTYPDGTAALRGIDAAFDRGEFVALIGQNGSGKTTFAKCLAGLLRPGKGEVSLNNESLRRLKRGELAARVGYVFQNPDHQLFNSSVEREISSGPKNLGLPAKEVEERVAVAAETAGIKRDLFGEHPFFLSKGLRQRVAIASILAMRPETIIVDEPTTGQDHRQSLAVMDFLVRLNRENHHTIMIITHDMYIVAAYAGRALLFKDGGILADGRTDEVFRNDKALKAARVKPPAVNIFSREVFGKNLLTLREFYDFYRSRGPA